jgi:hypothetical protein
VGILWKALDLHSNDELISIELIYGRTEALQAPSAVSEPSEATPVPAIPTANTGHKRQISEAIPSNKRANNSEKGTQEAGVQINARIRPN